VVVFPDSSFTRKHTFVRRSFPYSIFVRKNNLFSQVVFIGNYFRTIDFDFCLKTKSKKAMFFESDKDGEILL